MTAVHTPGTPGTTRRGKLAAIFGGITAALLIIGCAVLIPSLSSGSDENKLPDPTCANSEQVVQQARDEIAAIKADPDLSANEKLEKYKPLQEARDEARAVTNSDECKTDGSTSTTSPTAPPSGDACKGVTFSPYQTDGQRFGPPPVDLTNPGSPQDVAGAFTNQLKTNRWLAAAWSQGSYLVDGGIGTGEVQAKAQSFVTDHEAWRLTNAKLRAILGRSTFELSRSAAPYKTQEAIVSGTNQCVAPAAKDVGLESRGERLLLTIHMAAIDGGRTITVVVDCDGQIHITEEAPPAPVTPQPTQPRTTTPPATVPPTSPPPATTAPPPVVSTTQPPPPVTTTTKPAGKGPETSPCEKYPTMPGC